MLNGLSFSVEKGSSIGIIGSTGSGKSTALDLLMGLLVPTSGIVRIDGEAIISTDDRVSWRRSVAH